MKSFTLAMSCLSVLVFGCSLDTEGQAPSGLAGSGGSVDAAPGTGGTGGTTPVDASWPGDANVDGAAGTGGAPPVDAAIDVTPDVTPDVVFDVAPDVVPEAGGETACTNGLDDDGDELTDCADPDCSSKVRCVPGPPAGWTGPTFVRVRAPEEPATDCGPAMNAGASFHAELDGGEHFCNCSCGTPSGGLCGVPSAALYTDSACAAPSFAQYLGEGCHVPSISDNNGVGGVLANLVPLTVAPVCTPYAAPNTGEVSWGQTLDTCEAEGLPTGCDPDEVCVPIPPAAVPPAACVLRVGDTTCPSASEFSEKRTVFEDYVDGRDCSSVGCTCAAATGAKCTGTVRLHSADDCSFAIRSFDLDGACHSVGTLSQKLGAVELAVNGAQGGQCAHWGTATTTGSLTPRGPQTICCAP